MKPAIVIAGYNRPKCIQRILKKVNEAFYPSDDITLIISLDYSDKTGELEQIIDDIGWSHGDLIIRKFKEKQGLKKHLLSCGDLSIQYGAVIVLEDDLYISPNYYDYVIQSISEYENDDRVCGISLYCHGWNGYGNYQFIPQRNEYDIFMGQIGVSWGQCWTKKQWLSFKQWYERNKDTVVFTNNIPSSINNWGDQSWAKYFYNYMVEEDKYYVIPYTSLSTNFSEIGEHNGEIINTYQVMLLDAKQKKYNFPTFENAIKYDMYFERIFEKKDFIEGIPGDKICVNLYGFKEKLFGKEYLLTCKEYPGIIPLTKYGLRLRPIEQNVVNQIDGNSIFLYLASDIKEDISYWRRTSDERMAYELYGNPKRRLEVFCESLDKKLLETSVEINRNAWDIGHSYSFVQETLEKKINEYENIGETWMFHNIKNDEIQKDDLYSINKELFERLIVTSLKEGVDFKSLKEILTGNKNSRFLTFDDGYEGVYKYVFPICKKYNIPFIIFITFNYLGKEGYINKEQLIELSDSNICSIGAHTMNHPKLRFLHEDDIYSEIADSKKNLEQYIGKEVEYFAYPYGSVYAVDKRAIDAVEKSGFKMAFSTLATHNICDEKIRFFMPRKNISEEKALEIMAEKEI